MWHYHRSWKAGSEALITVGVVALIMFVVLLSELWNGGDYISLFIIFVGGIGCLISGIAIKIWARKNGKK